MAPGFHDPARPAGLAGDGRACGSDVHEIQATELRRDRARVVDLDVLVVGGHAAGDDLGYQQIRAWRPRDRGGRRNPAGEDAACARERNNEQR
jgi:hypothetical protein